MRPVLAVSILLASGSAAFGQQTPTPPPGSNWARVQTLPAGTGIDVKARSSHAHCVYKSADADSLTCAGAKDLVFQRADVVTVKIPHRLRSMAIAGALGAGAGMAFGVAVSGNGSLLPRGKSVAGFGAAGAVVGLPIGYATNFARSTIYRAQ